VVVRVPAEVECALQHPYPNRLRQVLRACRRRITVDGNVPRCVVHQCAHAARIAGEGVLLDLPRREEIEELVGGVANAVL
jgi:hypothetical protein